MEDAQEIPKETHFNQSLFLPVSNYINKMRRQENGNSWLTGWLYEYHGFYLLGFMSFCSNWQQSVGSVSDWKAGGAVFCLV